ncbi:MAG: DNA-3-methyladenine glycosylase [Desulfobacterales bacterium]|jgi:DNA-3-methyladenine glycosylase
MNILKHDFYVRDTRVVARELLGKKLVRKYKGHLLSGLICETEAYLGASDSACHAFRRKTERNAVMFGRAGVAYVYLVYGMHYLLNAVTEKEENPCAVLIRSLVPLDGLKLMQHRRGRSGKDLTNGPAKLCQAMAIDKAINGLDLTAGRKLWVEEQMTIAQRFVKAGPRIGIDYAKPADRRAALRFRVDEIYMRDTM